MNKLEQSNIHPEEKLNSFKNRLSLKELATTLFRLILSSFPIVGKKSKCSLPDGTQLVKCRVFTQHGVPISGCLDITMNLGAMGIWRQHLIQITKGRCMLAAIPSQQISDHQKQLNEYFLYLRSKDGYLVVRDPRLIYQDAKLQLSSGGKINISWAGQGEKPVAFSFESYLIPECVNGIPNIPSDFQQPLGPFIISFVFSISEAYRDTLMQYVKWGEIKTLGETLHLELGKRFKSYEIKCLLPESMPDDLKITLSLQPIPGRTIKMYPFINIPKLCLSKQEIMDMAAAGTEDWHFERWPLQNDCFKFIADERQAKVNIMLQQGEQSYLLQSVEFTIGGTQAKNIDHRNNELLLTLISKNETPSRH